MAKDPVSTWPGMTNSCKIDMPRISLVQEKFIEIWGMIFFSLLLGMLALLKWKYRILLYVVKFQRNSSMSSSNNHDIPLILRKSMSLCQWHPTTTWTLFIHAQILIHVSSSHFVNALQGRPGILLPQVPITTIGKRTIWAKGYRMAR
jgi:hypothetical protein